MNNPTLAMMLEERDLPAVVSLTGWGGTGGNVAAPRHGQDLPNYLRLDLVREIAAEAWSQAMLEAIRQVSESMRSHPSAGAVMPLHQLETALRRQMKAGPDASAMDAIERRLAAMAFDPPQPDVPSR